MRSTAQRSIPPIVLGYGLLIVAVNLVVSIVLVRSNLERTAVVALLALTDVSVGITFIALLHRALSRQFEERVEAEDRHRAADARFFDLVKVAPIAIIGTGEQSRVTSREHELLTQLVDRIPVMISIHHPGSKEFRINRAFEETLGWSTIEGHEDSVTALFPHEAVVAAANEKQGPETSTWTDIVCEAKDGRKLDTTWAGVVLSDGTQVGIGLDITDRKRASEALLQAEERAQERASELQAVLDTVPSVIFIAHDRECKMMTGNRPTYQLLRLPSGSNVSQSASAGERPNTFRALYQGQEIEPKQLPVQLAAATGTSIRNYEFDLVFEDGEVVTLFGHAVPLLDENGEPRGAVGAFSDVTALKRTETTLRAHEEENRRVVDLAERRRQELEESQELMHRALDVGRGFAFQFRMRSDEVIRSPESGRILGLPDDADSTRDTGPMYFQRVHRHDRARYVSRVLGLMPENDSYRTTYRLVRPDGRIIHVEESARGLFDENGTLIQVFGITQDVTDRVRAEQERESLLAQVQAQQLRAEALARDLQTERDMLSTIMENTQTHLAYLNRDFTFVKVNTSYARGSGYDVDVLLGRNHFELFPHEENYAIFDYVRTSGLPVEYRAKPFAFPDQPDRIVTYWDWTLVPLKDANGIVQGLVFSLSDVTEQKRAEEILLNARDELQRRVAEATAELRATIGLLEGEIAERKRAEAALRASEARLRLLVEQMPAVVWTTDKELRYTSSEGAGLATLKVAPGELVGLPVFSPGDSDDNNVEPVLQAHQAALAGESVSYQTRWADSYFECYVEPLRGSEAAIVGCIGVALDVTERLRSEQAKHEREQQYRSIFESTSDGMVILTLDGRIVDVNPAACQMSGYPYDEFVRLDPNNFFRADQRRPLDRFFQAVSSGQRLERQAIGVRKDGSEFDLELRITKFQHASEPHVLAVIRDVTERARAFHLLEQRVHERTGELTSLLAFSQQASATLEAEPLMQLVVDEVARLVDCTGVSVLMLEGDNLRIAANLDPRPSTTAEQLSLAVNEPDISALLRNTVSPIVLSDLRAQDEQSEAVRRVGGPLLEEVSLRSIMWVPLVVKQTVIGGIGVAHDEAGKYSEREARLVQTIANQAAIVLENARLYEQAHELAVLHERQRLARELHDSVTQSLYSLALMAEAARRLVSVSNVERGTGYLIRIGETAQQVLKEMRLLVYELRPLMLARDGLASALKQRLETVESRAGIETKLTVEGADYLPEQVETELYRIAQEALNNSLKYASASSVAVQICTSETGVTLTVRDNGLGFSAEEVANKGGLGLASMQERTQRLGGQLEIRSEPGQGVAIIANIPFVATARK